MPFARLVIIQPGQPSRELKIETELVTLGRALDNDIALADDSNVSRYHAEIELRGDNFWLADLRSRNGSTVNDQLVESETILEDGDLICFGGSTTVEFHLSDFPPARQRESIPEQIIHDEPPPPPQISAPATNIVNNVVAANVPQPTPAAVVTPSVGISPLWIGAAILGGLLLPAVVGAVFYVSWTGRCEVTVRIVSPRTGTTVKGPIAITVEAEQNKCVDRLIYQLDGVKIASSETWPYAATLDPLDISGLSAGDHVLTVVVEDDKGNRVVQPDEIILGFESQRNKSDETAQTANSSANSSTDEGSGTTDVTPQGVSIIEIKEMCERLLRQLSNGREYVLGRDLLHEIQTRTSDYATPGFSQRARPYRDVINDSFVNEQGLEKPLGYILAMSRSNFDLNTSRVSTSGGGEGLWKVSSSLARDAGYLGRCGTGTLADQNQKCAATVAAAYLKALEVDLFGGDPVYAVACFGMTPKDAAQWRDSLPADRRDLWNVIKSTEHRERVVRFFAAGIVGENPNQFGLTNDFPLSNLYPK
jgi:hypothetical protein